MFIAGEMDVTSDITHNRLTEYGSFGIWNFDPEPSVAVEADGGTESRSSVGREWVRKSGEFDRL